ncbi:porin [Paracoccus sp. (in: a-proteobacteria)]|uniref:porin n=1 Tax=Paracoccus sp. TaxID=267 RepID=UPI0026DF764C|nr:porin [Paracoccus sp. (in: a-proteobacteria)]MDO5648602.1 porin [Paracoccus sp. (in: a-proteobacteria)]
MKKALIASTALILSAGVAAADISLKGDARMGMVYDGNDVNLTSRARVQFNMSGSTDTGLEYGASFRAHQAGDASTGRRGSVWMKGEFGKLEFGDADSAALVAVPHIHGVGLTGLGDRHENTFLKVGASADNPGALYTYTMDGLTFAASFNDGVEGRGAVGAVDSQGTRTNQAYALGVSYAFDGYKVGLGYENLRDRSAAKRATQIIIGGEAKVENATIRANYGSFNNYSIGGQEAKYQAGISAAYKLEGGVDLTGFYRHVEGKTSTIGRYAGIGATYDLGGGAKLNGGIVRRAELGKSDTVADMGVQFNF